MFVVRHPRLGNLLPEYWFVVDAGEVVVKGIAAWFKVAYLEPTSLCALTGWRVIHYRAQRTLLLPLHLSCDQIFAQFHKERTQYAIRRAEKLMREMDAHISLEEMGPLTPPIAAGIVGFLHERGIDTHIKPETLLYSDISRHVRVSAVHVNRTLVLAHGYVCDESQGVARLEWSIRFSCAELSDQQVGFLNKWLHWQDIQYFKRNGFRLYDWGGISDDPSLEGINAFKLSFGGEVAVRHHFLICQPWFYPVLKYVWNTRTR